MSKQNSKGFTLIELLIVIIIISILATLLAVSYTTIQRKARDNDRKSDLQTLAGMLERFYSDNSVYPSSVDSAGVETGVMHVENDCTVDNTASLVAKNLGFDFTCGGVTYSRQLPLDPTNQPTYCYLSSNNNQNYEYFARLEEDTGNSYSCGGETWNYRVTSTD